MDLPTMWDKSVPITKFIGMPIANNAGPARKTSSDPEKAAQNAYDKAQSH